MAADDSNTGTTLYASAKDYRDRARLQHP